MSNVYRVVRGLGMGVGYKGGVRTDAPSGRDLSSRGIPVRGNYRISENAHLILPYPWDVYLHS